MQNHLISLYCQECDDRFFDGCFQLWDKLKWALTEIYHLLFNRKTIDDSEVLIFVIGCSIMGIIVITADWITFLIKKDDKRQSLLSLHYSDANAIFTVYLLWGIGSGVLGYLSSVVNMQKFNATSCLVIAISWPLILPKIIKSKGQPEVTEEVEQESNE